MIYLSYYRLTTRLSAETFDQLMQTLPQFLQHKILKFRNWQDAERSLAGNILLMRALKSIGLTHYSLDNLKYTEFQKPYLDEHINFNISHSGEYITCALSETDRVGVDVEEIKELPIEDFANLFASVEWNEVMNGDDRLRAFFTLWTKKEAFLKLIGCGLSQPLNEVVIFDNKIKWEGRNCFLHEIKLDPQNIAYICSDNSSPTIKLEEIKLP